MPDRNERGVEPIGSSLLQGPPRRPGTGGPGRGRAWRKKGALVLVGAIVGAFAALMFFLDVRGNYTASAILKYETSVAGYRRLASVAFSQENFSTWSAVKDGLDPDAVQELRKTFGDTSATAHAVSPFFRVTKRDLRDMPPTKEEEQLTSQLLGVQLDFTAKSPKEAIDLVKISASYLRELALWDMAAEFVRFNLRKYSNDAAKIENDLLRKSFDATQLEKKAAELRKLRGQLPESDKQSDRQLLSVNSDLKSAFFLSPLAQVVGAESELIELRRSIAKLQREQEQAKIALVFFQHAIKDVTEPNSGVDLLANLERARSETMPASLTASSEAVREVSNQIGQTLSEFRVVFVEQPLFVTGEHVAVQRVATPWKIGLFGALAGGLAVAFALVAPALLRFSATPVRERTAV